MADDRLERIEKKLDKIETALTGDEFGNKGYGHRLTKLEAFCKKWEQMVWMIAGGAAVISVIVNLIWKVI